jgi:hypothetical protein
MFSLYICDTVILLEKAAKTKAVHVGEQILSDKSTYTPLVRKQNCKALVRTRRLQK